jgi:hypothetical protein
LSRMERVFVTFNLGVLAGASRMDITIRASTGGVALKTEHSQLFLHDERSDLGHLTIDVDGCKNGDEKTGKDDDVVDDLCSSRTLGGVWSELGTEEHVAELEQGKPRTIKKVTERALAHQLFRKCDECRNGICPKAYPAR